MRTIYFRKRFKKDFARYERVKRDMQRFEEVLLALKEEEPLPPNSRDHKLTGNWKGHRECHLGGDWLLIYEIEGDKVYLERMGSHSELFG